MKKVTVLIDFSDDGQRFYKGEVRVVTPEKAGYYCGVGWASDGESTTAADLFSKTLQVQSAKHRSAASTGDNHG